MNSNISGKFYYYYIYKKGEILKVGQKPITCLNRNWTLKPNKWLKKKEGAGQNF